MAHASRQQLSDGGSRWGDFTVEFSSFPAGLDAAALLRGLPGDRCPCPHWGFVVSGRLEIRGPEGVEPVVAGEAYYMPPGHAPFFVEDTVLFEVSPADELAEVMTVVERNLSVPASAR
ncbi:MAG TPA: cupin domain-containing protein [Mycobacteriales bacterium]|nr:cupin domain-containing protein [Mycobacteriales bacterium]